MRYAGARQRIAHGDPDGPCCEPPAPIRRQNCGRRAGSALADTTARSVADPASRDEPCPFGFTGGAAGGNSGITARCLATCRRAHGATPACRSGACPFGSCHTTVGSGRPSAVGPTTGRASAGAACDTAEHTDRRSVWPGADADRQDRRFHEGLRGLGFSV